MKQNMFDQFRSRARALETETIALYFAFRDPRTPWYARVWGALVLAYALSPIDLIPDFIPLVGYLDDLILVPAGIALALRMIPAQVMAEAREKAAHQNPATRLGIIGAGIIALIWILAIIGFSLFVYQLLRKNS